MWDPGAGGSAYLRYGQLAIHRPSATCQLPKSLHQRLQVSSLTNDQQYGIVSGDRADHLRPILYVDRLSNGLSRPDDGPYHEQVPNPVDVYEELGEQRLQGRATCA